MSTCEELCTTRGIFNILVLAQWEKWIKIEVIHIRTHIFLELKYTVGSSHSGAMEVLDNKISQTDVYMPRTLNSSAQIRRHNSDDRYSSYRRAQGKRGREPGFHDCTFILVTGASGGIGVSTWCLELAQHYVYRQRQVCVVDADFSSGGLDVLMGCEEAEGLRWHNVEAPLGSIDNRGFVQELVTVNGLSLLPSHPWESGERTTAWWEIKAVFEALTENFSLIVVDCGKKLDASVLRALEEIQATPRIVPVIMASMDVLGAARAQILVSECDRNRSLLQSPVIIGSAVLQGKRRFLFGTSRIRGASAIDDTSMSKFLGAEVFCVIHWNARTSKYAYFGWSVAPETRAQRACFNAFDEMFISHGESEASALARGTKNE